MLHDACLILRLQTHGLKRNVTSMLAYLLANFQVGLQRTFSQMAQLILESNFQIKGSHVVSLLQQQMQSDTGIDDAQ
jgi:hypothetical protein